MAGEHEATGLGVTPPSSHKTCAGTYLTVTHEQVSSYVASTDSPRHLVASLSGLEKLRPALSS